MIFSQISCAFSINFSHLSHIFNKNTLFAIGFINSNIYFQWQHLQHQHLRYDTFESDMYWWLAYNDPIDSEFPGPLTPPNPKRFESTLAEMLSLDPTTNYFVATVQLNVLIIPRTNILVHEFDVNYTQL